VPASPCAASRIHGDSPIGRHLRMDRGRAISFAGRPFFGERSCLVQFVNEDRSLKADQILRFEALRARCVGRGDGLGS